MSPLAERMRPRTLEEYIGQEHLVGDGAVINRMIRQRRVSSFILWGPPGVGKTTLANIIAKTLEVPFYTLSAVTSGVKDVREVIEKAKSHSGLFARNGNPILFIDEIHRFSKSQQDSLLGAVEKGIVTLIGATTENPSFEVIRPLLSRCQVYVLKSLGKESLLKLVNRALTEDDVLKKLPIELKESGALLRLSGGDARKLLNILEVTINSAVSGSSSADGETANPIVITDKLVNDTVLQNPLAYDKDGEMHYDIISAFIKSIRGSDPDAMLLANACFEAVSNIGMPEGRIPLAETTIYLARSKKDNSAYMAIDRALEYVRKTGNLEVPLHIRNAPTSLMKELGYHDGYKYPHDYPGHWVEQQYLPDEAKNEKFYLVDE